jgi:hypothetical protein
MRQNNKRVSFCHTGSLKRLEKLLASNWGRRMSMFSGNKLFDRIAKMLDNLVRATEKL